jgi:pimeloyl-ACP methyl ester carboxylesterase
MDCFGRWRGLAMTTSKQSILVAPKRLSGRHSRAMIPFLRRLAAVLVAVLAWSAAAAAGGALQGYGVVFLHGKGVWPGAFDGGIVASLSAEGALVATPEMPWSFSRKYDATYEQAMAEIDAAVGGLRAQGATRLVIIGHSLGANAAIGYAARGRRLDAVVAIAPGHLPETDRLRRRTEEARGEAAALIAAGQGDARRSFPDLVQGIPSFCSATPFVYLSMFDPNGGAVIPKNVAAMPPIPFLWVVGSLDPIHSRGRDYAFARAPPHPKSRYLEVFASHLTTALVARSRVVEWVKTLER